MLLTSDFFVVIHCFVLVYIAGLVCHFIVISCDYFMWFMGRMLLHCYEFVVHFVGSGYIIFFALFDIISVIYIIL